MSTDIYKESQLKRLNTRSDAEYWSPSKKKRIKDNFLHFCDIVLSYTKYESFRHDEVRDKNNVSPLDSGGSTIDSYGSDTTTFNSLYHITDDEMSPDANRYSFTGHDMLGMNIQKGRRGHQSVEDEESYDNVSCFCGKPYAGRPMIECSACLTWLHLTCAKVRRNNIPETFICERCAISGSRSYGPTDIKQPQRHFTRNNKQHRKPGRKSRSPTATSVSPSDTATITPPSSTSWAETSRPSEVDGGIAVATTRKDSLSQAMSFHSDCEESNITRETDVS